MKHFIFGLALLLLAGQPAFSQEPSPEQGKLPPAAGVALMDHKKVANLQLDLLLEQRKVLEITADWLNAEQRVLNEKVSAWGKSRAELSEHLNKTFGCVFDLDKRACPPTEGASQ